MILNKTTIYYSREKMKKYTAFCQMLKINYFIKKTISQIVLVSINLLVPDRIFRLPVLFW